LARDGLLPSDVAVVVASPSQEAFVQTFASHSGIDRERVITSGDENLHTVSFVAALQCAHDGSLLTRNRVALFVCAGSGVTAGAAVYRT
jgi:3-oxoacyl-[acyl-carrier-protein] synthase III